MDATPTTQPEQEAAPASVELVADDPSACCESCCCEPGCC